MKNADYLSLLIVEKSEADAESLASILRDAGHSIHYDRADNARAFESALLAQSPDIVVCGSGAGLISTETVQDILVQNKLSLPVIAIAEEAPEAAVVTAIKSGIAALVSYHQPDHLELAVSRELTILQLQQKVAELDAALNDCENRYNSLVNNSCDTALDESLEMMARLDILTGLCNRQHFMNLIEKEINTAEKDGEERALIYITLDGFKEIREENGIAASDMVLCEIARLLERCCSKRDSIARFGDYSYTILARADSSETIQAMGERLLHEVPAHDLKINGQAIAIACSIGICAINEHSADAQAILSHADMACEVARSSGGNRIHTHSAVFDEQMSGGRENEWNKVIRATIDEERFYLAYQPIISLTGDTGKRYEALLRIVDEEGNIILPGQFLEIAEKSGLSCEIDYWIFNTAFKSISEHRENGDDVTIFLKLGRSVLADTNLPAWIESKLKEYRLSGSSVVFEIKEPDAANNLKSAITFVKAMKKLQCKVVLERFGMNNQPQILKHVPADILKIHSSLTENLANNKEYQSRVLTLVKLAHGLGVACIAENIDNSRILALLWQHGFDMIQGNFIQVPSRELDYDFKGAIA